MDRLSSLLSPMNLAARVYFSGQLCLVSEIVQHDAESHVHVLRSGKLRIHHPDGVVMALDQPSIVFFPQGGAHKLEPLGEGCDLVCASLDPGREVRAALLSSMPSSLVLPLAQSPSLLTTLNLLFEEAFSSQCGKQAALDRLMGYFLVLLLRHLLDEKKVSIGILAALADQRLMLSVQKMHDEPGKAWTLESLAELAGMSRARFANHFRDVTGFTALDYLTQWRVTVAQSHLLKGRSLKSIAPKVGYASAAALIRAFEQRCGQTPKLWLRQQGQSGQD